MPSKSNAVRTFEGSSRRGGDFTVETKLTNDAAVKTLREIGNEFAMDCAGQIEIMALAEERDLPIKFRENLVAWGFRLAEEKANAVTLTLCPKHLPKFRKPISFVADDGERVSLSRCGENSKHAGKIRVTNGEGYGSPDNRFYGYADPDGTWTPLGITPASVVKALTDGE